MSHSARRAGPPAVVGAALSGAALVGALLLGHGAATAQEPDGGVAETPIHDLQLPIHDLTLSVSSLDGSFTDSENTRERTVTLAADLLFEFDKADLGSQSRSSLEKAAEVLRQAAGGKSVNIDGYTDSAGEDTYNQQLSEARARTVEAALTSLVPGAGVTFVVAGHGEADPVAPNEIDGVDNPDGRAENRRVEIRFPR
jgi:outer membrane protein OmpA-like peptidoglycan-associated protein